MPLKARWQGRTPLECPGLHRHRLLRTSCVTMFAHGCWHAKLEVKMCSNVCCVDKLNRSSLTELSQSSGEPITISIALLVLGVINIGISKAREHNVEKALNRYIEIQNEVLKQKVQRCVKARELTFEAKAVSFVIERTISVFGDAGNQESTRETIRVFKENLNEFQEASCGIEVGSTLSSGRQELEKQKQQMEGNVVKSMITTLLSFFTVASGLHLQYGEQYMSSMITMYRLGDKWAEAFSEPMPSFDLDKMKSEFTDSGLGHTAPIVKWKEVLKKALLMVILSTLLVYDFIKGDPKLTNGITLIVWSLIDLMKNVHAICSTDN